MKTKLPDTLFTLAKPSKELLRIENLSKWDEWIDETIALHNGLPQEVTIPARQFILHPEPGVQFTITHADFNIFQNGFWHPRA